MVDVFNMLWRYGARFKIYGDIAIKLILTALTKQNTVLCEKLLHVGITKNTNPTPSLFSDIAKTFSNETINLYEIFREYFVDTKFRWNVVEKPLIHYVIERKDLSFCEILIKHRFDVNSRDDSGNLPVHVAAQVGDSPIMKQLIQSNPATINATNYANQAPLHLAAKSGHKKLFDLLQSFDANDFRDNDGRTAEDYAREQGYYNRLYVEYLSFYS